MPTNGSELVHATESNAAVAPYTSFDLLICVLHAMIESYLCLTIVCILQIKMKQCCTMSKVVAGK